MKTLAEAMKELSDGCIERMCISKLDDILRQVKSAASAGKSYFKFHYYEDHLSTERIVKHCTNLGFTVKVETYSYVQHNWFSKNNLISDGHIIIISWD
jgi:hypothetical protein